MGASLQDKTALVTGAASGIGRASAETFANEGARVTLCDRIKADTTAGPGGNTFPLAMDVTDETSVNDGIASATERLGGLDLGVLSMGIAHLLETTLEDWNRVIAVNLTGVFLTGRECLCAMTEIRARRAVDDDRLRPRLLRLGGTQRLLRLEGGRPGAGAHLGASSGPRSTSTPSARGAIETPLLMEGIPPELMARETGFPLGRIGQPHEIAAVVLALAGDAGTFTTGQALGRQRRLGDALTRPGPM